MAHNKRTQPPRYSVRLRWKTTGPWWLVCLALLLSLLVPIASSQSRIGWRTNATFDRIWRRWISFSGRLGLSGLGICWRFINLQRHGNLRGSKSGGKRRRSRRRRRRGDSSNERRRSSGSNARAMSVGQPCEHVTIVDSRPGTVSQRPGVCCSYVRQAQAKCVAGIPRNCKALAHRLADGIAGVVMRLRAHVLSIKVEVHVALESARQVWVSRRPSTKKATTTLQRPRWKRARHSRVRHHRGLHGAMSATAQGSYTPASRISSWPHRFASVQTDAASGPP